MEGYKRFKSWVAMQRVRLSLSIAFLTVFSMQITIDYMNEKIWKFYDFGPKDVPALVFLPGTSGTAEIYYKQFLSLCPKGYRLISVQYPPYPDHDSWCKGFDRFLDKMGLDKVHLFGTSLGGYLAQIYIQQKPQRVISVVLCNTFSDTQYYKDNAPCVGM